MSACGLLVRLHESARLVSAAGLHYSEFFSFFQVREGICAPLDFQFYLMRQLQQHLLVLRLPLASLFLFTAYSKRSECLAHRLRTHSKATVRWL
jgi:hypothetical protein